MDNGYELIFTILNRGFSDLAMDSARSSGATGGTIITARGTGSKEVEKLFGITISQEKEIILILTPKEKRNDIMSAICKSAGLTTQGKGIAFSVPVNDVLGVSFGISRPASPSAIESETPLKESEKALPEEENPTDITPSSPSFENPSKTIVSDTENQTTVTENKE